LIKANKKAKQQ